MNKLPKLEQKLFFATAHVRGGLKSSLGTCYKKSASAIEFSTPKLAKISWETKVDTISQMDLSSFDLLIKTFAIRQLIDSAKQNYLNKKFPTRRDTPDC